MAGRTQRKPPLEAALIRWDLIPTAIPTVNRDSGK